MIPCSRTAFQKALLITAAVCALSLGMALAPVAFSADNQTVPAPPLHIHAFFPGETLTYDVSWSKLISAGTATMEVKEEKLPDGRQGLKFVVTGRSAGLLDKIYPVHDSVESTVDLRTMESLSYSLKESYGGKKRRREEAFDHARNVVVSRLNDDPVEILAVPEYVHDGLSMLYYLRTREDFVVGRIFTIDVHDSGKNWSIEIHTVGRETVKTPMGEFATVKVKTYPKYKGVFMNKGEVFIWLTDDNRRIPVLMKSKLSFGSFVFSLIEMTPEHLLEAPPQ